MSTAPELSLIVPLFNQLALTRAMLDSLEANMPAGLAWELIFVDDGSTDATRSWLAGLKDPNIRVLLNDTNLGYAASNNRGASLAAAPRLLFLNNDTLLTPGWLPPLLEALDTPGVGIVGNVQWRIVDGGIDHCGIEASPTGKLRHAVSLPSGSPKTHPCLAVTGACCLLRTDKFHRAGGFDPAFHNGCEDVDLCLKLDRLGLSSVVSTASRIGHHVGASRGAVSERDEHNSRLLYSKWKDRLAEAVAEAWLTLGETLREERDGCRLCVRRPSPDQARGLALAALAREEQRWHKLFGEQSSQTPAGALPVGQTTPASTQGAQRKWALLHPKPPLGEGFELTLPPGSGLESILLRIEVLAGILGATTQARNTGLRLSINNLQTAEWSPLPPGRHSLILHSPAISLSEPTRLRLDPVLSGGAKPGPLFGHGVRLHRILADEQTVFEG